MTDRYTKVILTVIAIALTVIALRPLVEPDPAQALAEGAVDVRIVDVVVDGYGRYGSRTTPLPVQCIAGCR
jgi:hypothetical protein